LRRMELLSKIPAIEVRYVGGYAAGETTLKRQEASAKGVTLDVAGRSHCLRFVTGEAGACENRRNPKKTKGKQAGVSGFGCSGERG